MTGTRSPVRRSRGARRKRHPQRPLWVHIAKWLGLAGLLGVAAGGALIVRDERQRRAYTADEIRDRLHERAARAAEQSPEI